MILKYTIANYTIHDKLFVCKCKSSMLEKYIQYNKNCYGCRYEIHDNEV